MGIARPTGGYADLMLNPAGWPDVDENAFYDRADGYTRVLRQITEVLETCQHQQGEIFEGGIWSGSAASAANGELGTNIGELLTLQNGLATVVTWQRYIGGSIVQAKSDISDNVEAAHTQIEALEIDPSLDAVERTTAINTVISAARGANLSVMEGTAGQILASKAWKPSHHALKDLLDQKMPPPLTIPDTPALPVTPPPVEGDPRPIPTQPAPVTPTPITPARPPQSSPGIPAPPVPQPTPGAPATPAPPTLNPGGSAPAAPGGAPAAPRGPSAPVVPLSPAASAQPLGPGGRGKGVTPAAASGSSPSVPPRAEDSSAAVAPAAAPGMSGVPITPSTSGSGGVGAGSGSSRAGSGARVGQKPSGTSPATRPAAARSRAGANRMVARNESTAHPTPKDDSDVADAIAIEPIIPVSSARAERDAIAEAATAEAARRRGTDPLVMARRVAAALNAPGGGGSADFGFFWVTAVTADGAIVVANSYGLAYIPDGVQLPKSVQMATADEAIPAPERARWATYPMAAVKGWADRRDTELRAVIATEKQFVDSDPGVTKVVLKPDDIPVSGAMVGRCRLEVVDPEAADRLAATPDVRLVGLLPAAPAGTSGHADNRPGAAALDPDAARLAESAAVGTDSPGDMPTESPGSPVDPSSPADRLPVLWLDVISPMFSSAAGRDVAHLLAFQNYAAHAQEVLLAEAHAAIDPVAQRSAVTDWLYWKHLDELLDAALTPAS